MTTNNSHIDTTALCEQIQMLCDRHKLSLPKPDQMLIIEHIDSTDRYRLAPLVIITGRGEYRVSQGVFQNGTMVPGQSVTLTAAGRVKGATTAFGSQADDLAYGVQCMRELIEKCYLASTQAQLFTA